MRKIIGLYLITILSAIIYSSAFIFSVCWWAVIPGLFLLWFVLYKLMIFSYTKTLTIGCVWGVVFFSLHSMWLLEMLYSKVECPRHWAVLLYGIFIIICSLWIAAFFLITGVFVKLVRVPAARVLSIVVSTQLFFLTFARYGLLLFGSWSGYPFISPLIPLIPFLINGNEDTEFVKHIEVPYNTTGRRKRYSAVTLGQYYYHSLCRLTGDSNVLLFVGGESAYPFALNAMPDVIKLLSASLQEKQHLLLGSLFSTSSQQEYQALYWITHAGVQSIYLKKNGVPFFEIMPTFFKKCTRLRSVLNADYDFYIDTDDSIRKWRIDSTLQLVPVICSEFFLGSYRFSLDRLIHDESLILVVNDGWYLAYFRKIMENLVQLDSIRLGVRIIYVGHSSTKVLLPEGLLCKFICSKMLKMLV